MFELALDDLSITSLHNKIYNFFLTILANLMVVFLTSNYHNDMSASET